MILEVHGPKKHIDVRNAECNRDTNHTSSKNEIEISLGKISYILYVNDIALLYMVCRKENI